MSLFPSVLMSAGSRQGRVNDYIVDQSEQAEKQI